ncbi:hypothetical protein EV122DRAFT_282209 [Schizophyllum commune]
MSRTEPQGKEHFRFLRLSGRWQCERCGGSDMLPSHAAQHELTQKHRSAVERYAAELRRATIEDAESVVSASIYDVNADLADRDISSASLLRLLAHQRDLQAPEGSNSEERGREDPHHQHAPTAQLDDTSRDRDGLRSPTAHLDESSRDDPMSPIPSDPLREAIDHAIHLHATHQIHADSDSSSEDYDHPSEAEGVTIGIESPPTPYLHVGSQQPARRRKPEYDGAWRPWPNGLACTLDIASNLQRRAYSDGDVELMLWLLQMNGVANVPSLNQMKADQEFLDEVAGVEVKSFTGSFGHTYYMIPPHRSVRKHLQLYPEDAGRSLHECCQADRWLKEMDPHLLTQMIRLPNGKDFYVFEPAVLSDDSLCVPTRWFRKDGNLWARAWTMSVWQSNGWVVDEWSERIVSASEFVVSGEEIAQGLIPFGLPKGNHIYGCRKVPRGEITAWTEPTINPWRTKARGHRCVSYPSWAYCDDTSGNRSKKWNEHNSFLMVSAGLPREQAHQEANVHFLCTSNVAPPLEMLEGVVDEFEEYQRDGIWVYDSVFEEMVLVVPSVMALLGDNPMQSEFACHAGLKAKFFCRICQAKGKDIEDDDGDGQAAPPGGARKESEAVLFERVKRFLTIGAPRTPQDTKSTLRTMLKNVLVSRPLKANNDLRTQTGVKDTFLHHFLEKARGEAQRAPQRDPAVVAQDVIRQAPSQPPFSPVWRLRDLDPHAHTPIEILHVVMLGFLKYFWRDAVARMSDDQKDTVKHRLSSLNVRGLDPKITALRGNTLVQYCGSLVGRDFRIVSQTVIFAIYDVLPAEILDAWAALCAIAPLLCQPGTDDKEVYMLHVQHAIEHFLRLTMKWSPRWSNKPKFHLLLHIVEHIRLFGPPLLFATEVFESYNAVIRAWSVNSNGQAPSRDIARAAASARRVAHLLRAGFFRMEAEGPDGARRARWIQAGEGVQQLASIPSIVTRRLGLIPDSPPIVGTYRMDNTSDVQIWAQTRSAAHGLVPSESLPKPVRIGRDVVIGNHDLATSDDFAVLISLGVPNQRPFLVKIIEIVAPPTSGLGANAPALGVLVQLCCIGEDIHPYRMPRVRVMEGYYVLVPPKSLKCLVNVQHNCAANHCDLGNTRPVFIEREQTTLSVPATRHFHEDDMILNTAKLRDAGLVQQFVRRPEILSSTSWEELLRVAVHQEVSADTH